MAELSSGGIIVLEIETASVEEANILLKSIQPETHSAPSDRARVEVSQTDSILCIKITADDFVALRAATNSYLAWTSASIDARQTLLGESP
jgi:KEOPS complex subunit Pcc1